jgi:hypothetical protein
MTWILLAISLGLNLAAAIVIVAQHVVVKRHEAAVKKSWLDLATSWEELSKMTGEAVTAVEQAKQARMIGTAEILGGNHGPRSLN